MNEMKFTIQINATREKVWDTLWQDKTLREWAGIIDPGTYMKGNLEEGAEVEFISAENGYGVTSLIEKITPNEYLRLRHQADTQGSGKQEREKQWTGGAEAYELIKGEGATTLSISFDVPSELEQYFNNTYPKALKKIKELAEK